MKLKLAGKTLSEYLAAAKWFLAIAFALTVISVVWRLSYAYGSGIQNLFNLLGVIVVGWAGWMAVRGRRFNLRQAGVIGLLLFFVTNWILPIFHSIWEILYLSIVNAILFSAIAVSAGWLAKKLKKRVGGAI